MGNILMEIIEQKKVEVEKLKEKGLDESIMIEMVRPSLVETLKTAETIAIIAEIKRASPSKGTIKMDVNPIEQALSYERGGAAAISVLTDEVFFKGSIADLRAVSEAIKIPRLCKDFIIDEIQIDRAYQAGATIILLIVAALSQERLHELYQYAKNKGLDVLTEIHDEAELKRALELNAELIGINNRNLKTFEVDLAVTERLAKLLDPKRHMIISESGIKTKEDVFRVKQAGAKAILVGETLMTSKNLPNTMAELQMHI
ncbi:indole-3-glycerol phosphate synthase TrpC [Peribacillus muralis]|uniref:indole-3-glycerol phosphate synthase TrpC n=1 Tax=Peribacillus muralis TaxID=264697 RepID=UPI001F4D9F98|nr:indole-3-glycerol phosphate synthase TrpC [Peribacillus muralis]MCK1992627.1 indole-3-glycerol phosphate synthase TrpC [Peribacillus muralis]MCK2013183.1 indole-3-glycerol phosphate synthase TrpC [Peribacillus muralis]